MTYGMGNVLVNPYLFSMMGPYAYTSTWGDSIQFNVMPSYFSPMQASLTHGILNPNHVSQWSPMFSIPMSTNTTNPLLTQQGAQIATNWGSETFHGALAQIKVNDIEMSLKAFKEPIKNVLKDKNLTQKQRQDCQYIMLEIDKFLSKLQRITYTAQKTKVSNKVFCDEIKEIEKEVNEFTKTTIATVEGIISQLKSGTEQLEETPESTEQTQQEEQVQQPQQPQQTQQQQPVQQPQQPQQTQQQQPVQQPQQAEQTQQQATEETPAVDDSVKRYHQDGYTTSSEAQVAGQKLADAIYEAVDPNFGTDEETLEKAIGCINEYTVMETLDAWNKDIAGEFDGESMLESIYDDVFFGDARKKYTMHILDALVKKAQMENIDVIAEAVAIEKELDAWWRDDEKIFKLINEIHKNLGGKEYKKY